MPVEYVGITEEHNTVRNGVGVFDVSHMGEIWVKGPNALAFVQYVSSNDASLLYPGKVQYDCFPNGKGGIVDDFLAYCIDSQTYLLVVNAANVEKDWNHLCAIAPKFSAPSLPSSGLLPVRNSITHRTRSASSQCRVPRPSRLCRSFAKRI